MPIIVTSDFPPSFGGIQTYMERIARRFANAGEAVVVVAPAARGDAEVDRALPFRVFRYAGVGRGAVRKASDLVALLLCYLRALASTRDRRTVASAWWPAGLAASLVPPFARGPLVTVAHGMEIAPQRGGLRGRLMRRAYRASRAVAANSRYTRGLLAEAGVAANVVVVPCGVDARAVARTPAREPTILSVGRLVARKGFDTTLRAVAALRAEFPELRYRIVGNGPERAALAALARDLEIADRVHFEGAASDAALERAYADAWCFALPVRRIGDDVEGFGIVYLEAAVAGLATVGGRDSGALDAIADGETGLVVDGEDVRAVAAALRTLLRDPAAAAAMGARGRARALADFTWERTAHGIGEALRG